jgi:hypothetical protein
MFFCPLVILFLSTSTDMEFPSDMQSRIRWLLANTRIARVGANLRWRIFTTPEDAEVIIAWLDAVDHLKATKVRVRNRSVISLSVRFLEWLLQQAAFLGIDTSHFSEILQMRKRQVAEAEVLIAAEKTRLMELLYVRDGKRGCFDCGTEDEILEFLHTNRDAKKTENLSFMFKRMAFEKAEADAMQCQIFCIACRRTRTAHMNKSRFRKPFDACREKQRIQNKINTEEGRKRFNAAKLAAAQCQLCERNVTPDTLLYFDFDHASTAEKRWDIADMMLHKDETFYSELKKCRLLCVKCHREDTKSRTRERRAEIRGKKRKLDEI